MPDLLAAPARGDVMASGRPDGATDPFAVMRDYQRGIIALAGSGTGVLW
ncbi:MAG: hypothetical protein HYV63_03735 [Candidatus Schekmanbacteria bacterium]|nr:hypothetical protein [Candidatus Schekmanbacteria bacterium]